MTPDELARLTGYSRQTINKGYARKAGQRHQNLASRVAKPDWFTSMNRFVNIFAMLNVQKVREKRLPFLVMRRLKYCW